MKSYLLTLLAIFFSIHILSAQSYTLSWAGQPIGEEVTISGEPLEDILEFFAVLTNNSNNVDTIKVERILIDLMEGTSHSFCWGMCYSPNTDSIFISPLYIILQPGQSSDEYAFSGHYKPEGVEGISIVNYTFFNVNDESEKVSVSVSYNTVETGNQEIDQIRDKLLLFPNPARSCVNIKSMDEVIQLKVYNQAGMEVYKSNTRTNIQYVDVTEYDPGIYIFRFLTEKGIISEQVIIQ